MKFFLKKSFLGALFLFFLVCSSQAQVIGTGGNQQKNTEYYSVDSYGSTGGTLEEKIGDIPLTPIDLENPEVAKADTSDPEIQTISIDIARLKKIKIDFADTVKLSQLTPFTDSMANIVGKNIANALVVDTVKVVSQEDETKPGDCAGDLEYFCNISGMTVQKAKDKSLPMVYLGKCQFAVLAVLSELQYIQGANMRVEDKNKWVQELRKKAKNWKKIK